ncbi:MAG: flagellar transcriptional regulator FlhD [Candidatus Thiodiazotropha endolucinida]|nr:flagellar transcriptional regulator FlhD [Candidatus Thiodiazotropha taylori]MCW4349698.1 flagellar transcriptional regulator FlhD [Candidatus Thiodiazotropha endolucinida]
MRREEVQQGEEEVKIDFSNVNLEYLIHVRDVAREDPEVAASLLGMSPELATLLAQAPSEYLTKISQVKVPLMAARGDAIWWYRLFKALVEENREEVEVVLQAVSLAVLS